MTTPPTVAPVQEVERIIARLRNLGAEGWDFPQCDEAATALASLSARLEEAEKRAETPSTASSLAPPYSPHPAPEAP